MNITILTESLGSGGAERQVCTLAPEFRRLGHKVCVATYAIGDFYLQLLEHERIQHRFLGGHGRLPWALNVRRFLRTYGQDVVLALLPGPSAYAELAGLPSRSWGVVVSERLARRRNRLDLKLWLHGFADYVVTNSHSNRLIIEHRCPWLASRLVTIYNAVQLAETRASEDTRVRAGTVRLVVAARFVKQKNLLGLIHGLSDLKSRKESVSVAVDWFGNQEKEPDVLEEARKQIARLGLDGVLRLHPPTPEIHKVMSSSDAVLLPSYYEGLPNAVCEGMMLGKPILMSDACDARSLVQEGINGLLFNPHSPDSIADAICRFAMLSPEERIRMGRASRVRAQTLFDVNVVAGRYLQILEAAAERKRLPIVHWPEAVPPDIHA